MDNSNLTMEEYIRLEEEKARKRGKVFNWQTAAYGRIRVDDDFYDLRSMEAEFPAIVFNDTLTSEATLSCEPTVSSLNNDEIDFRISFDESDDEDCTVIFDKNSFSYKIISVNDLKTDSENDNDKVNIPLLPSLKLTVSYFDDLDYFKDFENEFPAIVYNDAPTSKSDLLTEPILSPQHIDEFDLKSETSLSEYNEEEQNVLCFNDLFPFNVIYPHDLKSDTGNDNDTIDIEQPSGDLSVKPLPDVINTDVGAYAHESNKLLETIYTAYSLNEYSVFDTGINTAYPGVWIRRIDFLYSFSHFPFKIFQVFDMDAYRDEGMGDVIFGEPFLREVGIKARRFEEMITIYNGNESVTYQMVRSHPRFKHHTNKQCNKIPPLLKVSDEDKNNGISHPYQKLKGFYKGVLNLGPDYIRDAKTKEWLTRGHISVHEMEW
ncbi:hypothetical protein Tco_0011928 [Tanacetum coccineum]